jgi:hypothetical protein
MDVVLSNGSSKLLMGDSKQVVLGSWRKRLTARALALTFHVSWSFVDNTKEGGPNLKCMIRRCGRCFEAFYDACLGPEGLNDDGELDWDPYLKFVSELDWDLVTEGNQRRRNKKEARSVWLSSHPQTHKNCPLRTPKPVLKFDS